MKGTLGAPSQQLALDEKERETDALVSSKRYAATGIRIRIRLLVGDRPKTVDSGGRSNAQRPLQAVQLTVSSAASVTPYEAECRSRTEPRTLDRRSSGCTVGRGTLDWAQRFLGYRVL